MSHELIGNGKGNSVSKDFESGANLSIDYEYSRIHDGKAFLLFENDIDLDTDESINICFETPSDASEIHMLAHCNGGVGFRLNVLEAPTITNGTGTIIDAINRNRRSSETSTIKSIEASPQTGKANKNATITADGLIILDEVSGSIFPGPVVGESGFSRNLGELVLKAGTRYAYRVTSLDENNQVHLNLIWYELVEVE